MCLFQCHLIISEEGFSAVQRTFLEKHCHHFEDSEENKFIYTDIFKQYVSSFETIFVTLLSWYVCDI